VKKVYSDHLQKWSVRKFVHPVAGDTERLRSINQILTVSCAGLGLAFVLSLALLIIKIK
jgi:hypothetical protein